MELTLFQGLRGVLEPFPLFQKEKLILVCFINWGVRFLLGRKYRCFMNKLENHLQYYIIWVLKKQHNMKHSSSIISIVPRLLEIIVQLE